MSLSNVTPHPRLSRLAINEEGFVFDPQTGESFTINPSGSLIIKSLAQGLGDEESAAAVAEAFDINSHDAYRDVRDFIEQLRLHNLF
ncbi:PqqD family peptide modification chaperone [Pseudomonadota bacterium]